ncbi:MAG: hypothetical protein KC912_21940 [Proteobacteria bacterium]|nr:hypothetical protein [Pseudomonadota bacterium]
MNRRVLVCLWSALFAVGCGDGESDGEQAGRDAPGSCSELLDGMCADYPGSLYSAFVVEEGCPPGGYSPDPCPSADLAGRCVLAEGTEEEQEWSFYEPEYTTELAEAVCNETEDASWLGL